MPPITSARFPIRCGPRRSPKSFIRATPRRPGRNCASDRNTSSHPPLSSTSSGGTSNSTRTCERLGRARRRSAQRHASRDRNRRTDAHPCRPQRARMGRSLGDHAGDLLLHQPYAPAGGAGELAGAADGAPAAAPHADHLSAQRSASRQRPAARLHRCGPARRRSR